MSGRRISGIHLSGIFSMLLNSKPLLSKLTVGVLDEIRETFLD